MADLKTPKRNVLFVVDAWLRRALRRLAQPGPKARVRLAALFVLLLGIAAGLYTGPAYWNRAAAAVEKKTNIHIPTISSRSFRLGLDLQGGTSLVYQADLSKVDGAERSSALDGVRDVIERRVNAFGVSEPLVQTSVAGGKYRVIVELAGVKNVQDAIKQIGETPTLEFKEQSTEPARALTAEEKKQLDADNAKALATAKDVTKQALASTASSTAFGDLAKKFSQDPGSNEKGGDLGFFTRETMIKEFGDAVFDKLKVNEITKEPVKSQFGYHIIQKTGERETEKDGKKVMEVSASHILLFTRTEADIVPPEPWKGTGLTGKQLSRAAVQFDQQTGAPVISIQFNDEGTKLFSDLTARSVGKPIAIFLDGGMISSPVVSERIPGGQAVISGSFKIQEARLTAQRLNAGALPVPITLLTQRTVGATLGEAALTKSLFAGLLGFLAVALFMMAFYRFPGVLATIALIIYTSITLALFKYFNVTMTLAGIAGFILSIGMAVDANVLIFERIKEEIRRGRTVGASVDEGFRRAWNSIRDSNFSSLITCGILYWFGTSIVRGFAFTLALGIAVSMFSAITVTRTFLRLTMGAWAEKHLWFFGVKRA